MQKSKVIVSEPFFSCRTLKKKDMKAFTKYEREMPRHTQTHTHRETHTHRASQAGAAQVER